MGAVSASFEATLRAARAFERVSMGGKGAAEHQAGKGKAGSSLGLAQRFAQKMQAATSPEKKPRRMSFLHEEQDASCRLEQDELTLLATPQQAGQGQGHADAAAAELLCGWRSGDEHNGGLSIDKMASMLSERARVTIFHFPSTQPGYEMARAEYTSMQDACVAIEACGERAAESGGAFFVEWGNIADSDRARNIDECPAGVLQLTTRLVHDVAKESASDPELQRTLVETMNRQRFSRTPLGRLTVHVLQARGLPRRDKYRLPDAFATLRWRQKGSSAAAKLAAAESQAADGAQEQGGGGGGGGGQPLGKEGQDTVVMTEAILNSGKPAWDAAFSFDVYDATQELVLQVFDQHYQHVLTGGPQGNAVEQLGSRGPHAFLGATSLDPALLMRGRGLQDAWLPLWSLDPLSDKPHTCCDVHVKARQPAPRVRNTKGYSSTYLAMGLANVRAGTQTRRGVFGYPPEH